MPIIPSPFKAPYLFRNGHVQTIVPALFRKYDPSIYTRERILTPDDDFLDLDWIVHGSKKLVIICHGLEGSSRSTSVVGMAKHLSENGFDVVVLNFRSCSGEMNRQLRFYHSGETGDLGLAVTHALQKGRYQKLFLLGFSLGGNVVLKYVGEQGAAIDPAICKAVGISVPCDLEGAAYYMNRWAARIYLNNFLKSLEKKIRLKNKMIPGKISLKGLDSVRSFHDFDNLYTGPMHGFADAHDYYSKSSSLGFLPQINIPVLMLNAKNDPFLSRTCYPYSIAENNPLLHLETPASGGHVGFFQGNINGTYWGEERALAFLENQSL